MAPKTKEKVGKFLEIVLPSTLNDTYQIVQENNNNFTWVYLGM
jgi:hypothetical protein